MARRKRTAVLVAVSVVGALACVMAGFAIGTVALRSHTLEEPSATASLSTSTPTPVIEARTPYESPSPQPTRKRAPASPPASPSPAPAPEPEPSPAPPSDLSAPDDPSLQPEPLWPALTEDPDEIGQSELEPMIPCPGPGTFYAELRDISVVPDDDGVRWNWTVTGELTNATGAAISISNSAIPTIYGMESANSRTWRTVIHFGCYDVPTEPGQLPASEIQLDDGQTVTFITEEAKYFGPDEITHWIVEEDSIAARLNPIWADRAYGRCPYPGGWFR